jgi:hypothetical protein
MYFHSRWGIRRNNLNTTVKTVKRIILYWSEICQKNFAHIQAYTPTVTSIAICCFMWGNKWFWWLGSPILSRIVYLWHPLGKTQEGFPLCAWADQVSQCAWGLCSGLSWTDDMPVRRQKEDIIHSLVSPEQPACCSWSSLCVLVIKVLYCLQSSIL